MTKKERIEEFMGQWKYTWVNTFKKPVQERGMPVSVFESRAKRYDLLIELGNRFDNCNNKRKAISLLNMIFKMLENKVYTDSNNLENEVELLEKNLAYVYNKCRF